MYTDLTASISGASGRRAVEKMLAEDGNAPLDAHYVTEAVKRARECGTSDAIICELLGFTPEQVASVPR